MKLNICNSLPKVFLFTTALFLTSSYSSIAQEKWTEDIFFFLINMNDRSELELNPESLGLTTQEKILRAEESLENILLTNGFYPDAEAFGVIYQLNPELEPDSIDIGTKIILPKLQANEKIQAAIEEGYRVALTLDYRLKKLLLNQTEDINKLARRFFNLNSERFEGDVEKGILVKDVNSSLNFLRNISVIIRERSRPLDSEMLHQTSNEAEVLTSNLSDIFNRNRQVTSEDQNLIQLIAENMIIRAQHFMSSKGPGQMPSRYPQQIIKVIALKDGNEIDNLEVYYVLTGLKNYKEKINKFTELTSPASQLLEEANYFIWLGKPGDSTPVSDEFRMKVRRNPNGTPAILELAVN